MVALSLTTAGEEALMATATEYRLFSAADHVDLGHELYATHGTRDYLAGAGIPCRPVNKISGGAPDVLHLIAARGLDLVVNDAAGTRELSDNYKIRRAAVEANIACLTSLDTARALADALSTSEEPPRTLQEYRSTQVAV